ncbi:MAG TPA: proline dehydrogenase family protein [Bacteroidota bacterium]|nr:proline dehydrogenase family protein [Bacteroidota bacterium]
MNVLNKLIVATLPTIPKSIVRRFANRYIAGEEISDAVRVVRELNGRGIMATLDVLGEHITRKEEAAAARDAILEVLSTIRKEGLNSNVSIKLTQLGLKLDRQFCLENVRSLVKAAGAVGNFVRIDMEESAVTDDTLWVYREIRRESANCGIALQAYLRRTGKDAERLIGEGWGNFRFCKGIYIEPEEIAYKQHDEINGNYTAVLRSMLEKKAYVGIATHDPVLVENAYRLIAELGLKKSEYEFQMLLGVRPDLRDKIVRDGHRLRIYVPFGRQWYQYSIRRFKENPQVAGHVFRALFTKYYYN